MMLEWSWLVLVLKWKLRLRTWSFQNWSNFAQKVLGNQRYWPLKTKVLFFWTPCSCTCSQVNTYSKKKPQMLILEKSFERQKPPCSFLFLTCCLWSLFFSLQTPWWIFYRASTNNDTFIYWTWPDYHSWLIDWITIIVCPIVVPNLCWARSINCGLNKSNICGSVGICKDRCFPWPFLLKRK